MSLQFKRITPLSTPPKKKYYIGGGLDGLARPKGDKKFEVPQKTMPTVKPASVATPPQKTNIPILETRTSTYHPSGRETWVETKINHANGVFPLDCAIMIPVYKTVSLLKDYEKASLKRCCEVLGKRYDIVLAHPSNLNIDDYRKYADFQFSDVAINPDFFKRQKSYSNLCERYEFYDIFKEYKYMLVYQLDAWIFEDRLKYFMDMDYDYIGGVHLLKRSYGGENGNGGFSLRKVEKFSDVCKKIDWTKVPFGQLEDCAFTQRFKNMFNLAPLAVSFEFSWQEHPEIAITKNNNKLPMGCHAFKKFGAAFWTKYIKY